MLRRKSRGDGFHITKVGLWFLVFLLIIIAAATNTGNNGLFLVLAAMGNVVFLAMGFAVAGRADSVDAATNIAGLITIPLMFLTGMFFPVEAMPSFMQSAVDWLPMTPLIEGMRMIALESASLADLGSQLALLGAWVVAAFAIARLNFRFGGRSAIAVKTAS